MMRVPVQIEVKRVGILARAEKLVDWLVGPSEGQRYRSFTLGSARHGTIVRGRPPLRARHDPEGCPVPRDLAEIERWLSGGFEGIS